MRLPLIDLLKVLASQLIVLHHLAFYGPMSEIAHSLAPSLLDWLAREGRLAVQVFLVVGGFLAARSLASRNALRIERPLLLIWRRYCRLAIPLVAALALAIACAAAARSILPLDTTPGKPGLAQLFAHLLLLQDLLGYEALSAGVWYVAIDFQLYALMVVLIWLSRRWAMTLVAGLAVASLFHFNRIPAWDDSALYFFGAYALGALACWAGGQPRRFGMLALMVAAVALALMLDFRSRIAVALASAVLLGLTFRPMRLPPAPGLALAFLGDISYSVFLVHYPVCLVVNAAFGRAFPADPAANALGMLLAWGLSLLAGALFHRYVERPGGTWLRHRDVPRASRVSSGSTRSCSRPGPARRQ